MIQIRTLAKKGEMYKAKLTAQQIAHYRSLCDKNFEREVMIGTRAQVIKEID